MNKTSRMISRALKLIKATQGDEGIRRGVELSARALSDALASEYPAFDEMEFLRACGVKPTTHTDERPGGRSRPP
jgi:hypothetical protein